DRLDDEYSRDEFAACGIKDERDLVQRFVPSFYFGCEAEDPMNAWAFSRATNPLGARLNAIFGSDIGHWDVRDMREVVEESWELVDEGVITKADYRAFVFENPVHFWTAQNPEFFAGTSVESAARKLRAHG
ncbi:MAG TPA: amidohydrolase, partial [Myxococcota bacterium]|nr:amidohydrolase [Myxococcota bacterium]